MYVPVVNSNQEPLMPTTPARARRWVESGKATPFWKKGVWCVRLNAESKTYKQPVVLGIDPGSKKEGLTVKSASATYLNINADAVDGGKIQDKLKSRREMRRARRYRNRPYHQPRWNKGKNPFPPSTKARWQWKLRLMRWLQKMYPITDVIVEDIKASTHGKSKKWNKSFSPLETGKRWFYKEVRKSGVTLHKVKGIQTYTMRNALGLTKTKRKMDEVFEAHCVDSWVMANSISMGHLKPDNTRLLLVTPLIFHRRQLHRFQASKGGIRRHYGGTMSLGLKRGGIVVHPKWGTCYVGGSSKGRISLHHIETGKRLTQNAKKEDLTWRTFNTWRVRLAA